MSTVAIVQARMTSSRFPGKVLRSLAGRALLWHIVRRVARATTVDRVVVACSVRTEDDAIAAFCRDESIPCVRGSEANVLDRFRVAREQFPADVYVRICGDSPLVAPEWVDRCVSTLRSTGAGYTIVEAGKKCVHAGVDVLAADALDRLLALVPDHPVAREHITGYFKVDPGFARGVGVPVLAEEEGEARLSVDVPEDLEFFERLYAAAQVPASELTVSRALAVIAAHPALGRINAGVRQRRADERPATVFLYGEGGGATGWGHLSRLMTLARSLRRAGANVLFGFEGDSAVAQFVAEGGFACRPAPAAPERGEWLRRELQSSQAEVLFVDTCGRLPAADLQGVRALGVAVLLLDDIGERVALADAVYNPAGPRSRQAPAGFTGEWHAGWHCVPLREEFLGEGSPAGGHTLLVTMGGSDPRNFTRRALRALRGLPELAGWTVRVVLGRSYAFRTELEREAADLDLTVEIVGATPDMAGEMRRAHAVLLAFGVTAYEAAALGRPMACFCLGEDHRVHASAFVREGCAVVLDDDPAGDAAALRAWLAALPETAPVAVRAALRSGTTFLTGEILRWARRPATIRPPRDAAA